MSDALASVLVELNKTMKTLVEELRQLNAHEEQRELERAALIARYSR